MEVLKKHQPSRLADQNKDFTIQYTTEEEVLNKVPPYLNCKCWTYYFIDCIEYIFNYTYPFQLALIMVYLHFLDQSLCI